MKSPQLNEADKRAVDMLLDELPQSRIAAAAGYTASAKSVANPESLDAARLVMSLLEHYEVPEPPTDLVARCMARIGHSVGSTTQPSEGNPLGLSGMTGLSA